MKNNYIIITTLCDDELIANKIINILLKEKLVAGVQIEEVKSLY